MTYIQEKLSKEVLDKMNHQDFIDRFYFVLKEDGVKISYGDLYSKWKRNGIIKVLKSLGIYKTKFRGDRKTNFIHERLKLIIDTTCQSSNVVSKTIIDMYNGVYKNIESFSFVDICKFISLPDNEIIISENNFGTYIVFSENTKLFKIGKTKDLGKRIKSISNNLINDKISLIGFTEKDIESELHIKYNNYRVSGEWFNITIDIALDICNEYNFKYKI